MGVLNVKQGGDEDLPTAHWSGSSPYLTILCCLIRPTSWVISKYDEAVALWFGAQSWVITLTGRGLSMQSSGRTVCLVCWCSMCHYWLWSLRQEVFYHLGWFHWNPAYKYTLILVKCSRSTARPQPSFRIWRHSLKWYGSCISSVVCSLEIVTFRWQIDGMHWKTFQLFICS